MVPGDEDIPPSKCFLTARFLNFLLFCSGLKKGGQRKDEHDETGTKRKKPRPRFMDCTEVQAVGFNTGNNRKENPEKIAIKENTPHPRSPI
jgi:hypothetical protein